MEIDIKLKNKLIDLHSFALFYLTRNKLKDYKKVVDDIVKYRLG